MHLGENFFFYKSTVDKMAEICESVVFMFQSISTVT